MKRIKVIDLELSHPLPVVDGLHGYQQVQALLRWHGCPLGYIKVPVRGDRCSMSDIGKAIIQEKNYGIIFHLLRRALQSPAPACGWTMQALLQVPAIERKRALPNISVAVCTRDRTESLRQCLTALLELDFTPLEILVIDNAPRTNATRELLREHFPTVRYVLEPRPGLDWARNRAIAEARGEILAYTDDDVIVDRGWTRALARLFAENKAVAAVTGLVVPFELETEAQILFEEYGGFGRGFERKWYRVLPGQKIAADHGGAGKFGTGANMAFRKEIFTYIGGFDPALDVGTVTQGGGDLEIFFRVIKSGLTLVYEPDALVRHQHRRDMGKLETQIASNGIGFYSYLVRSARAFPDERRGLFKLGLWWLQHWSFRRWLRALFRPTQFPRKMLWEEFRGSFVGLVRYGKARRNLEKLKDGFGPAPALGRIEMRHPEPESPRSGIAVRAVELARGLKALDDVTQYGVTRIYLTWKNRPLGVFDFDNHFEPITPALLADAIVDKLGIKLLERMHEKDAEALWAEIIAELSRRFLQEKTVAEPEGLPQHIPVSIVIATYDRPEDLRNCLCSLTDQITLRRVEIVVVDNHPASAVTREVIADFPWVRLLSETRGGLSYARNAGFAASTGEILICIDDDVIAPPDWLEKLLTPFARNDVMLVTGNVLPFELETNAQIHFETYGGLGRGYNKDEFNREWVECYGRRSVPTWKIGATANAAVRAEALADPRIGLLDEALGAGTPTGCSEDTYLFYHVLNAGETIVYEPGAYLWHRHRREEKSLGKQIFNYSKGHVAYHLTTLFNDNDFRALTRLGPELGWLYLRRIANWLCGDHSYPMRLMLLELLGTATGPWALWRSRRRVKKLGRSEPYLPLSERQLTGAPAPFTPESSEQTAAPQPEEEGVLSK